MKETSFIPFLTLLEKEMPFYVSTIGSIISSSPIYRPHGIEDCQLLYIKSGRGEVLIDNTVHELNEKSILFLPPNSPHNYYPVTHAMNTRYITFGGSGTADFKTMPAFVRTSTSDFDFSKWYKLLYKYKYTPNHEKSLSVTLYASLLDFKTFISLNASASSFAAKKNAYILAMHEMANNYALSLSDIAEKLNLSEAHFCRTFKAFTGMRPIEYLNFLKIHRAKELLKSTDTAIARVAELSGFQSSSYFTMLFKRYTGTTPKEYRNT